MQKKLTVIIPAYNVENYIDKCLRSVVDQNLDYSMYEIIVVNDGSVDSTPNKLQSWSLRYDNLKVLNQDNAGQSFARNRAIRESKGEYLMFVDADDFIEPNCLMELIDLLELGNLDLLRFSFKSVDKSNFEGHYKQIYSGPDFIQYCKGIWTPWMQIVRSSFMQNNGLFFVEGITSEDAELLPRLYLEANRVMAINSKIYHYTYNPLSTTKTRNFDLKRIEKRILSQFIVLESNTKLLNDTRLPIPSKKIILEEVIIPTFTAVCAMMFQTPISFSLARYFHRKYKSRKYYPIIPSNLHSIRVRIMYSIMNYTCLFYLFYFSGMKFVYSQLQKHR